MTAGNIPDRPNCVGINRERWKLAMIEHFRQLGFTHALTLAWNQAQSHDNAIEDLKALHWRVDRKLFGRHLTKRLSTDRTLAVFVFEGVMPGGHLHVHSLWRLRSSAHLLPFARLFPGERGGIWNKVAKAGSCKLAIADDCNTFAGYALKGQHMSSDAREIVWSGDFIRK